MVFFSAVFDEGETNLLPRAFPLNLPLPVCIQMAKQHQAAQSGFRMETLFTQKGGIAINNFVPKKSGRRALST